MDEIKIKGRISDGLTPEEVRYDERGIHVGHQFFKAANPRLAFARVIKQFEENRYWNTVNDSEIRDNTFVAVTARIGKFCSIGGDGFGYVIDEDGELFQMPHRGAVRICANVEIHNNVCIDRAVTGFTVIGEGTKIDNLVHIAHGVKIGVRCQIVAGSVIGGSVEIGDDTFVGINASIKNKVKIGRKCVIGMGAIVLKDVPDGTIVKNVWKG